MPNEQAVTVRIADAEEVTAAIQTTIGVVTQLAARVDALEAALRDIRGICKRPHFTTFRDIEDIERRCDAALGEAPPPGRPRVEMTSERVVRGATYWISTHQRATGHTTTVVLAGPSPSTQGMTIYAATGDDAQAQARHDAAVAWVLAGRPGGGPVRGEGADADA